jgi:hypothetical protein
MVQLVVCFRLIPQETNFNWTRFHEFDNDIYEFSSKYLPNRNSNCVLFFPKIGLESAISNDLCFPPMKEITSFSYNPAIFRHWSSQLTHDWFISKFVPPWKRNLGFSSHFTSKSISVFKRSWLVNLNGHSIVTLACWNVSNCIMCIEAKLNATWRSAKDVAVKHVLKTLFRTEVSWDLNPIIVIERMHILFSWSYKFHTLVGFWVTWE